jgi:hypothetical protein
MWCMRIIHLSISNCSVSVLYTLCLAEEEVSLNIVCFVVIDILLLKCVLVGKLLEAQHKVAFCAFDTSCMQLQHHMRGLPNTLC